MVYATDVTRADIWRPDVYVDNAPCRVRRRHARSRGRRSHRLSRRVTVTECHMYFGKMPFDEQECAIISTHRRTRAGSAGPKDMQGITMRTFTASVEVRRRDFARRGARIRRRPRVDSRCRRSGRGGGPTSTSPTSSSPTTSSSRPWCGYFVTKRPRPRGSRSRDPRAHHHVAQRRVLGAPRIAYPTWLCDILFVTLCFTFFACLEYGAVLFPRAEGGQRADAKTFPKMRVHAGLADHAAAAAASAPPPRPSRPRRR